RRAAHPDLIILGGAQTHGDDQVVPHFEQLPGLVEHLDADIVAVRDVETASRIETNRVRNAELSELAAQLAPLLDVLAGVIEVDDSGVDVTVGDKDVPFRGDDGVRWLVEVRPVAAGLAGSAEGQQQLAVRRKLLDGVMTNVA